MNIAYSERVCDNKSVGMLIWKNKKLLLIQRAFFPFGYAPPAGHVDEHGSYEEAMKNEVKEEVGLSVKDFRQVLEKKMNNSCRRVGGSWHYWKIYEVDTRGTVKPSKDETKKTGWYSLEEIKQLSLLTEKYLQNRMTDNEWEKDPGIETVWYEFFKELNII